MRAPRSRVIGQQQNRCTEHAAVSAKRLAATHSVTDNTGSLCLV